MTEGDTTPTSSVSDSADGSTTDDSTSSTTSTTGDPSGGSTGSDSDTDSGSTGEVSCEGQVDVPDPNGLDENGDGIDGVVCNAVFVNGITGSDLNDGLAPDDPVETIDRGIEIAGTYDPPRMVLVAAGTYLESITLSSGVSIYGGYGPETWSRNVLQNVTEIAGVSERTVVAQNLSEATEVDGFTITAADAMMPGTSSYGVWVRDIPDGLLTIDYCTINGGNGAAGDDGDNGDDGSDGLGGGAAVNGSPGAGGASACGATGGAGGSGQACPSTDGGDGSAGVDMTTPGPGGPAGASECSGNTCNDTGADGTVGLAGSTGVNGDGGETAAANPGGFDGSGLWVAPAGTDATRGFHGSGGGGGGAGGYDVDSGVFCTFFDGVGIGGGGGGGGAGGCGGDPGGTGQPGGGSFAFVAINASVSLSNTDIFMGNGGAGGNGGDGGDGGLPGPLGTGANGVDNGGEPGDGENGAAGGGGGGAGGGAGGCGGASVGIATVSNSTVGTSNVSFTSGTPGSGGTGGVGGFRTDGMLNVQAPEGDDGCDGYGADQAEY